MKARFNLLTAMPAALALAGCESTTPPGPPASVEAVSSVAFTDTVGVAIDSLVVRVIDASGREVPGASVAWTATGGGEISPPASLTDGSGLARARWLLGTTAGEQRARALVATAGAPAVIEFTATSIPAAAATGAVTDLGTDRIMRVAEMLRLSASFVDRYGNPVERAPVWTSSNEAVATVGSDGVAIGRGSGVARITASLEDVTAAWMVAVGPLRYQTVSSGGWQSCGLITTGEPICWKPGWDPRPRPVQGAPAMRAISAGETHTCAISIEGKTYCWGTNEFGQLGNGTTDSSARAVAVRTELLFSSVSAGYHHTCALTREGAAHCWGRNDRRQLGTATSSSVRSLIPVAVEGGLAFEAISAQGWLHTCGLAADGAAYCWGYNGSGQLGSTTDGSFADADRPRAVESGAGFTSISTAYRSTCGTTRPGDVLCWGSVWHGAVGVDTTGFARCHGPLSTGHACTAVPSPVPSQQSFQSVTNYRDESRPSAAWACARDFAGQVSCWGRGEVGPTQSYYPNQVPDGVFASVDAGLEVCGRRDDGVVYCWQRGRPQMIPGQ